jgi:hypothetical protein
VDRENRTGGYGGSLLHVRQQGRLDEPQCASIPRPGGRNHLARTRRQIPSRSSGGPDRAGLAELMTTTAALDRDFSLSQSVLRTVPMWQPLRKAESARGVTILALDSACFRIAFAGSKTSLKPCPLFKDRQTLE